MATREEAHQAIDRLYDKLAADSRDPLGCVIAVPHSGSYPGLDHTTIETEWELLRHERMATVLHGAVAMLRLAVDEVVVTHHGDHGGEYPPPSGRG